MANELYSQSFDQYLDRDDAPMRRSCSQSRKRVSETFATCAAASRVLDGSDPAGRSGARTMQSEPVERPSHRQRQGVNLSPTPQTKSPPPPAGPAASALTASGQAAASPGYRPASQPAAGKATRWTSPAAPHTAPDSRQIPQHNPGFMSFVSTLMSKGIKL